MLTYSIAIRTLGTGGDNYRRELESIVRQTVQPERVVVYIAEGYPVPEFRIGREEYVAVAKGMTAQRALPYDEIDSDCILTLDDDVELAPDAAERLLRAMEQYDADCISPDTFGNCLMAPKQKLREALVGLVFPSRRQRKAFRLRRCGAVSYMSRPATGSCHPSDRADGPAQLWRRQRLTGLRPADELWVERDGFAYGEDTVLTHKVPVNGGRLFVLYDHALARHLDSGNSSAAFRKGNRRMYIRTKNSFIIWWRCIYEPAPSALTAAAFIGRSLWNLVIAAGAAVAMRRLSMLTQFFSGLRDGVRFVCSDDYKQIPKYKLQTNKPLINTH
ncbi:MAG: glycosyltransferase [Muribaculaceae bacterium]|nr:glycosyltransferase [Muribaculaceae bacterium]